ncbi:MAG: hypothetical protein IJ874_02540 [Ruminococcus sp.]|nr:hypothetical protein [Ruminococcus sp.]
MEEFGFTKGTFPDCFSHFKECPEAFEVKKDFVSPLVKSYVSALSGVAAMPGRAAQQEKI